MGPRKFAIIMLAVTIAGRQVYSEDSVSVWMSSEDGVYSLSPGTPLSWEKRRPAGDVVILIDEAKTYQSILGFGASLEHATCFNLSRLDSARREEVIERLVDPEKGIGMNLMRVCIGTSDFVGEPYYSYDDIPPGQQDISLERFSIEKDRAYVLPAIKAALQKNPNLLFFASPWSPPAWMKTTDALCGGKLKPEYHEVYARYLAKFIQAYEAEGIPIYAITPQNEPRMVHPDYPTCVWTGEQQRDFIREALGPALRKADPNTLIWCWDHNWNDLRFPRTVLSDTDAAQYVDGTGFHHYEGRVEAQSAFQNEFPDKHIYFTEGSTFRTAGAIKIIDILRNWARSYNAWVILLNAQRKPNNGPHHASATCIELKNDLSVEYRFDYYMYGQFMKYIRREAVRLDSTAGDRRFANVALKNPDGTIVLVVANAGHEPIVFEVMMGERLFQSTLGERSVATYRWPAAGAN